MSLQFGAREARTGRSLRRAWDRLVEAQRRGDPATEAAQLAAIGRLIEAGDTDRAAWSEIMTLIDARRRLCESERHFLVQSQQTISAEAAIAMMDSLVNAVLRTVPDPAARRAVAEEYQRLIGRPQC